MSKIFSFISETTAFAFILNIFTFKKGAGFLLSLFLSIPLTISTTEIFGAVLKNTDVKNLIVPIFVEVAGFTLYFLFNLADFGAGIWFAISHAKRYNLKNFFENEKLYKTLWKMLGVLLLTILIMFIAILSEIIGVSYAHNFFIFALTLVLTLACLYEFRSIGKNIEKRTGSKPEIFGFMDKVLDRIQKRTLKEIDNANVLNDKADEISFEPEEESVEEVEEIEEKK